MAVLGDLKMVVGLLGDEDSEIYNSMIFLKISQWLRRCLMKTMYLQICLTWLSIPLRVEKSLLLIMLHNTYKNPLEYLKNALLEG